MVTNAGQPHLAPLTKWELLELPLCALPPITTGVQVRKRVTGGDWHVGRIMRLDGPALTAYPTGTVRHLSFTFRADSHVYAQSNGLFRVTP